MDTWTLGANPGTVLADGVTKVGNTSVSWDAAGKPVVTFPIPGVAGATGTATLDAKYMTEKVVVTQRRRDDDRVHLQQLSGLEQPAAQDRGVLRRPDDRAEERRGGPRPDDERDGDGQCVCGGARAAERAEGDERHDEGADHRVCEDGAADEHDGAHAADRQGPRSDGELDGVQNRLDWELHGERRAAMRSDAGATVQPGHQPDRGFRALLTLAVRPVGSSALQAGALGQGASSSTCGRTSTIRS